MLEIIKEIGIFIVIAQAVLYFVPGEAYVKYVKVIIGIIMVARIAQPFLSLWTQEEWDKIMEQAAALTLPSDLGETELLTEENTSGIYSGIEQELADRLKEANALGYEVESVTLKGREKENGEYEFTGVLVTVSEKQEEENGTIKVDKITIEDGEGEAQKGDEKEEKEKQEELKRLYGQTLGIDEEGIEVRMTKTGKAVS